jgi:hypothetical protein
MSNPQPLAYDSFYHIFNRGNNGETLFRERRNYPFFLERYVRYIEPVAETYAYCLMNNHFHLLIHTRTPDEQHAYADAHGIGQRFTPKPPSQAFGTLFNAYARAINTGYGRSGSLFEHPFHRIPVETGAYLWRLVVYIHRNPQHHGFAPDFRSWSFSSYRAIVSSRPTRVQRAKVLAWFGNVETFVQAHETEDFDEITPWLVE